MSLSDYHNYLVKQGFPVVGLSASDENDKTSWKVYLEDGATEAQKTAAKAALLSFVYVEPDPELSVNDILDMLVSKGVVTGQEVAAARSAKKVKG